MRATPLPQDDNWVGRGGEHMSHVVSLALNRETISLGELRGPTSGGKGNILRGVVGVKGIWSCWVGALVLCEACIDTLAFIAALDGLRHPEP